MGKFFYSEVTLQLDFMKIMIIYHYILNKLNIKKIMGLLKKGRHSTKLRLFKIIIKKIKYKK